MKTRGASIAAAFFLLAVPVPSLSEDDRPERATTPPRVSLVEGEVSFWRVGAADWAPAKLNVALAPGDELYSGADAYVEVQIGGAAWVRGSGETNLGLQNLDPDFVQFRVSGGRVTVDLRQLPPGTTVELGTPWAALTIDRPGYYRIEVAKDEVRFVARRGGSATVRPAEGSLAVLSSGKQVRVVGTEDVRVEYADAAALDELDGWSSGRTDRLLQQRSQDLPADMYGVDELNSYGDWRAVPTYGRVWVPRVAAGWVPYSTGRWMWDSYYGWTWVDDAPWGWAPFHYGRWVYVDSYWAWTPGPVIAAPVYAPALVAFFDCPPVYVGVATPGVAWVALGWGEPLIPWWGPVGFVGVPWWGGWYGPYVVNHVVVRHGKRVHAHDVKHYDHARRHRGVVSRRGRHFGHGPAYHVSPNGDLRPIRGRPGRRPGRDDLGPGGGSARRPPDDMRRRPIVGTRAPRDPLPPLRDAGLDVGPPDRIPSRVIGSRTGGQDATGVREPRARARDRYIDERGYSPPRAVGERPGSHGARDREAPAVPAQPSTAPHPWRADSEPPKRPTGRRGGGDDDGRQWGGSPDRAAPPLFERPRASERRRFQEPPQPRNDSAPGAAPAPPVPPEPGADLLNLRAAQRVPRPEARRGRERRQPAVPADGGTSYHRQPPRLAERRARPQRESVQAFAERPRVAERPRFSRPPSETERFRRSPAFASRGSSSAGRLGSPRAARPDSGRGGR